MGISLFFFLPVFTIGSWRKLHCRNRLIALDRRDALPFWLAPNLGRLVARTGNKELVVVCPGAIPDNTRMRFVPCYQSIWSFCASPLQFDMTHFFFFLSLLPGSSWTRSERDQTRSLETVSSHLSSCENLARVTVRVWAAIFVLISFQLEVSKSRTTACSGVAAYKSKISCKLPPFMSFDLFLFTLQPEAIYLPS